MHSPTKTKPACPRRLVAEPGAGVSADNCLGGHIPRQVLPILRAPAIFSPEGRGTGAFPGQERHSPKLLGTGRTVQGGSIYSVPDSQLSTYPEETGLALASHFALFKYYSWCQENGKGSLGGAVRGEIYRKTIVGKKRRLENKEMSGEAPGGTQGTVALEK